MIIGVEGILFIVTILAHLAFIIFHLLNQDPVIKKIRRIKEDEINLAGKRQKNTFQKY
jgi:hypothetical protein